MARIPEDELERIKRATDLVALVRASGVELAPQGRDLVGRCIFHGPDETPSLVVTPDKQLYLCSEKTQRVAVRGGSPGWQVGGEDR